MAIEKRPLRAERAAGLAVHLFTASGAAAALFALDAAIERSFAACFAWLGLAFLIDGIDGALARAARVRVTAPEIDGAVLDLVIDFLTYVVVPIVALQRSDLMPASVSLWVALLVTVASALYFADTRMKTGDFWFRGFPAVWNVVVLYLFVLRPTWLISAGILLAAAGMMFSPLVFVHPMRVTKYRTLTLLMSIAWAVFAVIAVVARLEPPAWVKWGLVATAGYFLVLPLLRHSPWASD